MIRSCESCLSNFVVNFRLEKKLRPRARLGIDKSLEIGYIFFKLLNEFFSLKVKLILGNFPLENIYYVINVYLIEWSLKFSQTKIIGINSFGNLMVSNYFSHPEHA